MSPRFRILPPLDDDDEPARGGPPRSGAPHSDGVGGPTLAVFLAAAPTTTDHAAWTAGLVAALRRGAPETTPRRAAQAVAKLGVFACLVPLVARAGHVSDASPDLAALMDVRNFLERPRTHLRRRVESTAFGPRTGTGLVPSLAHLLARAALAEDGDEAAALVLQAVELLARARGVRAMHAALQRLDP